MVAVVAVASEKDDTDREDECGQEDYVNQDEDYVSQEEGYYGQEGMGDKILTLKTTYGGSCLAT